MTFHHTPLPTFHLTFATPESVIYDGPATSLSVPGLYGSFEVLEQHAPIIALLHPGTVLLATPEKKTFQISKGVFEMSKDKALLLVDKVDAITPV